MKTVSNSTGKRKYSCLHWGTVTDDLKFIPGRQYLYAPLEERAKLIFPEGWDLSEIDKLQSDRKQGRPAKAKTVKLES